MRKILTILLVLPLLLAAPDMAGAAGKDKSKGKPAAAGNKNAGSSGNSSNSGDVSSEQIIGTIINVAERVLIGDYVNKAYKSNSLPPGLANRDHLPPGLQRQIERNGTLPPGLAKRGLPSDLRQSLPHRAGQDYRVVGNDIVLIETATLLILDVMKDVLRN